MAANWCEKVNENNGAKKEKKKRQKQKTHRKYIARSCFYDTEFHLLYTLFIYFMKYDSIELWI